MARGFGRSLDLTTLMVLLRHRLTVDDEQCFSVRFDKIHGFSAWYGKIELDEEEVKWYETMDSALLALIIGQEAVPGTHD